MATILLTWELGGGLGHLINLFPLAQGLSQRGHRVYAAVQDIGRAERAFRSVKGTVPFSPITTKGGPPSPPAPLPAGEGRMGQSPGLDIAYLQAPAKIYTSPGAIEPQRTFAHILHNHGFGDRCELRALASAWRGLFELARPDLIVFDHSPTGLLAARGLPARKAIIGSGFFCPVDECPMADLRPWLPAATERLRQEEDQVLANANAVLAAWGQPPLERLSRLFHDVDECFLATLPELDHYAGRKGALTPGPSPGGRGEQITPGPSPGGRGETVALTPGQGREGDSPIFADLLRGYPAKIGTASAGALTPCPSPGGRGETVALTPGPSPGGRAETRYWGVWPNIGGRPPCWPEAKGKRVFAYVRPFPALPRLLKELRELRQPTIVYCAGIDEDVCRRFATETMRFENQPLDLAAVGESCDLAILNGTNGTTSMLLAGRPTLQVPIALEHALFSQAVSRLGAGILAAPNQPSEVVAGLMQMLGSDAYAEAAQRFAAKYSGYDPQQQVAAVVERAEELLRDSAHA